MLAFRWRSFSLAATPNFCSSSIISRPRSLNPMFLPSSLVRTDQNVDLAGGQVVGDLPHLFRAFHAAQVLDPHGEFFQPVVERSVMLQGEDRGRNQHGDLFRVGDGLESGADRDLGLAEADVAADQPVHRRAALHILLDQLRGGLLVGRVFVDERGFQLVLQVTVRRICETFARLALGVQRDQLAGDVLDRLFRVQLHALPGARSQLVDFRRLAVLIFVLSKCGAARGR